MDVRRLSLHNSATLQSDAKRMQVQHHLLSQASSGGVIFDRIYHRVRKLVDPAVERFVKGFFFAPDYILNCFLSGTEFRKDVAHRFCDDIDKFEEEWLVKIEH